jgi:GxxExxY protein
MDNRRKWAIIRATMKTKILAKVDPKEERAAKKALKEAERVARKALKEEEKEARRMEREAKKAAKAAEKAAKEPKKRGRPPKKPSTEIASSEDMPAYAKADLIRSLAEEVHRELGAGHLESVYHKAMEVQFRLAGMQYETERVMDLKFKEHFVGTIRADIILMKECVLEFKISGKMDDAVQQARQYMKLQGLAYGFVVLFPKTDGAPIQMVDARLPSAIEA